MFKEVDNVFDANLAIIVSENYDCGKIVEKLYYKIDKTEDVSDCVADVARQVFIPFDMTISVYKVRFGRVIGRE